MSEPASAYLRAVPSCTAGFVYTEQGISKTDGTPAHIVNPAPFYPSSTLGVYSIPVEIQSLLMSFPTEIPSLVNQYEAWPDAPLWVVFREASITQYCHLQVTKLDKHYHRLFGFLAAKDSDIWAMFPSTASSLRIERAVQWMYANNDPYSKFFHSMRHLCNTVSPLSSIPSY